MFIFWIRLFLSQQFLLSICSNYLPLNRLALSIPRFTSSFLPPSLPILFLSLAVSLTLSLTLSLYLSLYRSLFSFLFPGCVLFCSWYFNTINNTHVMYLFNCIPFNFKFQFAALFIIQFDKFPSCLFAFCRYCARMFTSKLSKFFSSWCEYFLGKLIKTSKLTECSNH